MSSEETHEEELQDSQERLSGFVHRLHDLLVQEVSSVDRAANKRTWLVVKSEEGDPRMLGEEITENADGTMSTHKEDPWSTDTEETDVENKEDQAKDEEETTEPEEKAVKLPKAVKAAMVQMLETASNRLTSALDAVKGAETTEEKLDQPVPQEVGQEIKNISSIIRGVLSKYPSPAVKSELQKRRSEEEENARSLLWDAMKEIDKGAFQSEADKKVVNSLLETLRSAVMQKSEEIQDPVDLTKALTIPGPVKEKMVKVVSEVLSKLTALVKQVKEAQETDEEMPEPVPEDLGKALLALSDSLNGLSESYPSPQAKDSEEQSESTEGQKKDQEETASTDKSAVSEAVKLLQVALGKLQPGKALDDETLKSISRAKEILVNSQPKETGDQEKDEEKRADTKKAGAKLSLARRKQFKEALDSLMKLFEEVLPESERKQSWPTKTKKEDVKKEETEEKEDPRVLELQKSLEETQEKMKKLQVEINKAQERPATSRVIPTDGDSKVEKSFKWGFDLNDEE